MVEGLDRLKRKLTKTIPSSVVDATKKAMEASADEVVGMMQRLAPKDTGKLSKTIGWTWGEPPKGAMVLSRSPKAGDGLVITIYAGDETTLVGERAQFQIARLQEFGTQSMKASPFFFPSWRALRKRARSRVIRQMRKAIRDGGR